MRYITFLLFIIVVLCTNSLIISCSDDQPTGACIRQTVPSYPSCSDDESESGCLDYFGIEWHEDKTCSELGYGDHINNDGGTDTISIIKYDGYYSHWIYNSTYKQVIYTDIRFFNNNVVHYYKHASATTNATSDYLFEVKGYIKEGSYNYNPPNIEIIIDSTIYATVDNNSFTDTNSGDWYSFIQFSK